MSSFTKPLKVKVLDNGKEYEILEEFTYYRPFDNGFIITVEAGFITDFASVPRIFWSIYPPFGKYTKAAVLHDKLCTAFLLKKRWNQVSNIDNPFLITRKDADSIFKEAMKAIGVDFFTRNILYFSVRLYAIFKYGFNK